MSCGLMRVHLSSTFASRGHFSSGGRLQVIEGVLMVLTPEGWVPVSLTPEIEKVPLTGETRLHFSGGIQPDESLQAAAKGLHFSFNIPQNPPTPEAVNRIYLSVGE